MVVQVRHVNGMVGNQMVTHPSKWVNGNNATTNSVVLLGTKCSVVPLDIDRTIIVKQFKAPPPQNGSISMRVRLQRGVSYVIIYSGYNCEP